MCQDILENGTSTEGEKVRPHWEDGTSAYTIKKFGVVNRYDLSKEFPAITLRKTAIKTCTEEMLWIWQRKSNNIHDLNSTVWDEWADENGSIGKAYGYQLAQKHQYREGMMDQVDRVIYDLKNNPFSRRILTNIYVHQDLHEMNLYPCAYSMTFNVTQKQGDDKLTLNAILNQRSQDVLTANNWNVCQYAVLMHMLAQVCDMKVGERYRISSIEPNLLTDEIVDWIASGTKFQPHFHIPLQSGSDTLLKDVGRKYSTEFFASKIDYIREKMNPKPGDGSGRPDVFFGIDVIAGLPGETDELFMETYNFLKDRIKPAFIHIFPYSRRAGTRSAARKDQVQDCVKTKRVAMLEELCKSLNEEFIASQKGVKERVLFEESNNGGMMSGYTGNYIKVERPWDEKLAGQIVEVTL